MRLHPELWRRKNPEVTGSRGKALEEDLDSKTKYEYGKNMIFHKFKDQTALEPEQILRQKQRYYLHLDF